MEFQTLRTVSLPGLEGSTLLLKSTHRLNDSLLPVRGAERHRSKKGVGTRRRFSERVPGKTGAAERKAFLRKFGHSGCCALGCVRFLERNGREGGSI